MKKSSAKFKLALKLGDKTLKGEGNTEAEALLQLNRPVKIITKGILTLSHGSRERVLVLQPIKVKRLFLTNPLIRGIVARQLFYGLK